MLTPKFSNQFKKDYKLMEKRHKNMQEIVEIMDLLVMERPLPERCREHNLSGNYAGFTECHIKGDWVLIYYLGEAHAIYFSRTGTHSDLF
jgi:mRNA interferase YafQ